MGKERLSRSISLSLSLKSPLETVPSSTEQSPIEDAVGAEAANPPPVRSINADLSPTTALARLTFDSMETGQLKTEVFFFFHSLFFSELIGGVTASHHLRDLTSLYMDTILADWIIGV